MFTNTTEAEKMDTNDIKIQVKLLRKSLNFGLFVCGLPMKIGRNIQWLYYAFTSLLSSFLIMGSIVTAFNTSQNIYKVQATIRVSLSIIIAFIFIYFCADRKQIKDLFLRFHQNSPNYVGNEEIKVTAIEFLKNTQ